MLRDGDVKKNKYIDKQTGYLQPVTIQNIEYRCSREIHTTYMVQDDDLAKITHHAVQEKCIFSTDATSLQMTIDPLHTPLYQKNLKKSSDLKKSSFDS